ncbi:MAG: PhnD/SsuA/transferrin family substrate-binding protein [Gammaproteobacteria bacterium]|nr:PhnD/SsuA/transferrin family substrate-binding protein [Gammaproteobacteria bacterium]MCW8992226.1 PhnD/SsuA/transferrin family substrate-binding protein [Gammaproteobacteria bacterium]
MLNRRQLLLYIAATTLASHRMVRADEQAPVRIGITPVFQTERTSLIRDWRDYLERHLERPVQFEQSNTYRDIINNLLARRLDFAWICGLPYVTNRSRLQLTAVPLFQGKPLYRSYLIVPIRDTATNTLTDLRDRVFAYADPDSNSGFLVPRFQLIQQGIDPDTFFRKTFFTSGHRNAIEAVSVGLAGGAHVDGYVWESMQRFNPEITRATRVVTRSREFGFPPLVAGPTVSATLNSQMGDVLLGMGSDPTAASLLDRLNLDGFTSGDPAAYEDIAEMAHTIGAFRHVP